MTQAETLPLRPGAHRIDDAQIEQLVHRFYTRVQSDPLIGPVFGQRVESWAPHLERMVLFWRAVLKADAAFEHSHKGSPPQIHRGIAELKRAHFERWLELFALTSAEIFDGDVLTYVTQRSHGMARALSRHLEEPWT